MKASEIGRAAEYLNNTPFTGILHTYNWPVLQWATYSVYCGIC